MKDENSGASMDGRPDKPAQIEGSARDEDELRLIFYLNEDSDDPRALRAEIDHYCDQVDVEAEPMRSERIARCIRALWSRRWAGWSGSGSRRATSNTALTHEQWTELSRQALGPSHGERDPKPLPAVRAEMPDKESGATQRAAFPIQEGDDFQSPACAEAFPATDDHRRNSEANGALQSPSSALSKPRNAESPVASPKSVDSDQTKGRV